MASIMANYFHPRLLLSRYKHCKALSQRHCVSVVTCITSHCMLTLLFSHYGYTFISALLTVLQSLIVQHLSLHKLSLTEFKIRYKTHIRHVHYTQWRSEYSHTTETRINGSWHRATVLQLQCNIFDGA